MNGKGEIRPNFWQQQSMQSCILTQSGCNRDNLRQLSVFSLGRFGVLHRLSQLQLRAMVGVYRQSYCTCFVYYEVAQCRRMRNIIIGEIILINIISSAGWTSQNRDYRGQKWKKEPKNESQGESEVTKKQRKLQSNTIII